MHRGTRDCHDQPKNGCDEGYRNVSRELVRAGNPATRAERVKRADHADGGTQQTKHGCDGRDNRNRVNPTVKPSGLGLARVLQRSPQFEPTKRASADAQQRCTEYTREK